MTRGVPPPLLSIGELARRVGASPSALRYWERAGLLETPERVGGRRRYRPAAVDRVGLIRLCQDAGFGIGEIRALLAADAEGHELWRATAGDKLGELHEQIARLQVAAQALEHVLACPHPSLSACPTFAAFMRWRAEGGPPPVPPECPDLASAMRRHRA